ncbi:hypothetical protein [Paenibacillus nuruki]|uniref:hypothetical protein n=1 Tax=Paenibacillus nuruki TaxID=1886670 RepID=UPI0028047684|nr:hypothetical protein [Paenibacillus nuruki]CAJ1315919.1 Structural protein [Paenibacillus nuruki]
MANLQLHEQKYEDLLARHGRDVLWQEAVICSCFNMDSGQPDYNCKACSGTGYVYEQGIVCRGAVQNVTTNKDFLGYAGMFEVGDALMTVSANMLKRTPAGGFDLSGREPVPMFYAGIGDLITLIDDEVKTSEVLIKSSELRNRPADTLLNPKITKILSIRTHDSETGQTTLYMPEDYTFSGAHIDWIGNQPEEGQQYSVVYMHRPVYKVYMTLPRPRHQNNQEFPRTVILRYYPGGVLHEHANHTS